MMRRILLALFALAFVVPAQAQNYNATAGSGLVFGSKFVGSVNYPQWVLCDPTTPAQCAAVNGSGQLSVAVASGADTSEGSITSPHTCATSGYTVIGCIGQVDDDVKGPIGAQSNHTTNIGAVDSISAYPGGATPLTASATGTTAATTATLAGTTGKTTYICSYSIRANATANANVQNTVTGIISGTRTDQMWIPANTAGLGVDEQIFTPCIPASATNTGIAVVSGAPGTGGNVTVNVAGYQL